MENFLSEYIAKIQASRNAWQDHAWLDHVPTGEPPERVRYDVEWSAPTEGNLALTKRVSSLQAARDKISVELWEYLTSDTEAMMLFTADPGIGKSTLAIKTAQELADKGWRVLYLMPRHDYWEDITNNFEYRPGMWYHWRGTNGEGDWGEPMCRYASETAVWTGKGYPLMDACKALCGADDWIRSCPYRRQSHRKEPIIAGVHNHAQTGLAIKKFDVVFIDELPVGAFLADRLVPSRFIDVGGRGRIAEMLGHLTKLTQTGGVFSGKRLLDEIGDMLTDVYDNVSMGGAWLPIPPELKKPSDVNSVREWYIYDLLLLLVPEHMAWKAGQTEWLERVSLDAAGLHLLLKKAAWKDLPSKVIAMDATGIAGIYQQLFDREVVKVSPRPIRQGRIFQIPEKAWGISTVFKDGKMTKAGEELLALGDLITHSKPLDNGTLGMYEHVGVITYKCLVPYAEAIFGVGNVLYFGGNRGTNIFVDRQHPVECVIVLGTPQPPDNEMAAIHSRLTFNPDSPELSETKPLIEQSNKYGFKSIRTTKPVQYHYVNDEGRSPYRNVSGFWGYNGLNDVLLLNRESELRQSAHRGRLLTRPTDVWLITTVSIDEELDGLWATPNECLNVPKEFAWKKWVKLRYWVMQQSIITVDDMVEHGKVTPQWARRWMKTIAEWRPEMWAWAKDPAHKGKGRPKMVLKRVDFPGD